MIVLDSQQTAQLEQCAAQAGMKHIRLMENAGTAAARMVRERYGAQGRRIAVLCGRGNNGGDGFVAARRLTQDGAKVTIVLLMGPPTTADAAEMLLRATSLGVPAVDYAIAASAKTAIEQADVLIDALFGTGFHGAPKEPLAALIAQCNQMKKPIVSLDLPSGAQCDSARVEGECFRASQTVAFHTLKPAHVIYPAAEYCGEVLVAGVGAPEAAMRSVPSRMQTIDASFAADSLPRRAANSNKGDFGRVVALCGSVGMAGAAVLSARAASCCGAGLVEVCAPRSLYPVLAGHLIEQIITPLEETDSGMIAESAIGRLEQSMTRAAVCLAGCGMGVGPDTTAVATWILSQDKIPVVLDADGINCIAQNIHLLSASKASVVLTPHPGEMARLLGCTAREVQQNRVEIASTFAREYGVTLVLKGAGTLVASADGNVYINRTGNHGMAKGGSGDLLAGMIASLIAQGLDPALAAATAVYFHGLAGDLAAKRWSARAMQPGQMLETLAEAFVQIERGDLA